MDARHCVCAGPLTGDAGEKHSIQFDSGLADEDIDQIFEAIRVGTEEDFNAAEPSNDYPDRAITILRLLKQTDMNSEEITSMVQDIFPDTWQLQD